MIGAGWSAGCGPTPPAAQGAAGAGEASCPPVHAPPTGGWADCSSIEEIDDGDDGIPDAQVASTYDDRGLLLRSALDADLDGHVDQILLRTYDDAGRLVEEGLDRDGDGVVDDVLQIARDGDRITAIYQTLFGAPYLHCSYADGPCGRGGSSCDLNADGTVDWTSTFVWSGDEVHEVQLSAQGQPLWIWSVAFDGRGRQIRFEEDELDEEGLQQVIDYHWDGDLLIGIDEHSALGLRWTTLTYDAAGRQLQRITTGDLPQASATTWDCPQR